MATQAVEVSTKRPSLRERLDLGSGFTPYFLVLPTVIAILAVAAYPILNSIWLSFLVFTMISVTLETIFGLGIALLIHDTFPGRGLVRASILIPLALPTVISAQMWSLMYNDRTGIISYLLQQMHLLEPGATVLQTNSGILTAAIVADVWKTTPFMALLLLAGLEVIPTEMYEAANIDGATRFQQFWTITLPMISGSLTVALLFRTLASLGVFDLFYVLGGNQVQSMSSYSYNYMFTRSTFDFPPGVAAALVLFVIVICQIAYRFSAMTIVLKGVLKLKSTRK